MKSQRNASTVRFATLCSSLFVLAGEAIAQAEPRLVERQGSWINWVVLTGVVLVATMSGFIKAKRSHLN